MSEIIADLPRISSEANGLHVTKKFLSLTLKPEYNNFQKFVIDIIAKNVIEMAQNPYGNYTIQIVLDSYNSETITEIIHGIIGKVLKLSVTKYSSNVIEKCMEKAEGDLKEKIINEFVNTDHILELMINKYGTYVIQKALTLASSNMKEELLIKLQQSLIFIPTKKVKETWNKIIENAKIPL